MATHNLNTFEGDPKNLSAAALAFVGDGVFELLVREKLLSKGSMPAGKLHSLAVEKVKASAQAKAYPALENILDREELDILRRGRNVKAAMVPKSCTHAEYRMATAIEALVGYLYLCGRIDRLQEVFAFILSEQRRLESPQD
ncbi:MAG: ribonuclease III [Oscillospiraceae bacterium]|nr:ribonuclease III [Oscillospiraceae bacterium]